MQTYIHNNIIFLKFFGYPFYVKYPKEDTDFTERYVEERKKNALNKSKVKLECFFIDAQNEFVHNSYKATGQNKIRKRR